MTRLGLTLKEWPKVKSDTTKRFAAYGFLTVNCTWETSRTNNKRDRDTFVKHINVGDSNGCKSKTTNQSTATKITHRLSLKLIK